MVLITGFLKLSACSLVSKITDKIMPEVREWQSRPLDDVYPVVFFDGVWFKGRTEGKVTKKCVHSVLGITVEGKKDILGIWVAESESASFWVSVFNDLKNRGVKDILIACHDNLTGFSKALETAYPRTENQLCIVHQIRNSLAFVNYKDRKVVAADLVTQLGGGAGGFRALNTHLAIASSVWLKDMATWIECPEGYNDIAEAGIAQEMANRTSGTGQNMAELGAYLNNGVMEILKYHKKL